MSEIQPTILSDEELFRAARSYFIGHGVLSLRYQEELLNRFEKLLDKSGDNE